MSRHLITSGMSNEEYEIFCAQEVKKVVVVAGVPVVSYSYLSQKSVTVPQKSPEELIQMRRTDSSPSQLEEMVRDMHALNEHVKKHGKVHF